ncbi:MAG: type VI secretion system accessory protein TagJ [Pseudomonadota bacterium]
MQAEDLLRSGDVAGARDALQNAVRSKPQDARLRIFLFQLLCITGEWERAVRQLKVSAELDPTAEPMARAYRETIICELYREKVFAGDKAPLIFGEPNRWIALLIEALKPMASGDVAKAAALRAEAFQMAPATAGAADGQAFGWIADADMRLGPVLELIVDGKYFWAPFSSIGSMRFEAPKDLRDRVWTAVEICTVSGGEVMGFIPTRYPGSVKGGDPLKLATATEWRDAGEATFLGLGQRLFATDRDDLPLMDLRHVALSAESGAQDLEGGAAADG